MNLCSSGHEEICFDTRDCPLCDMMNNKDEAVKELLDRIDELKDEIKRLEEN